MLQGCARWLTKARNRLTRKAKSRSGRATVQTFEPEAESTMSSLSVLSRLSV